MTRYEVGDKIVSTTGTALGKTAKSFKKGSEGVVVSLMPPDSEVGGGDIYVYFNPVGPLSLFTSELLVGSS